MTGGARLDELVAGGRLNSVLEVCRTAAMGIALDKVDEADDEKEDVREGGNVGATGWDVCAELPGARILSTELE